MIAATNVYIIDGAGCKERRGSNPAVAILPNFWLQYLLAISWNLNIFQFSFEYYLSPSLIFYGRFLTSDVNIFVF